MGLYHRFPEPHDYTTSREQVRGAIMDRFGLPKDFSMYFSIEVRTLNGSVTYNLFTQVLTLLALL